MRLGSIGEGWVEIGSWREEHENINPSLVPTIYWAATLILLVVAAGTDLKDRLIPNRIVIAIAAVAISKGLVSTPGLTWISLLAASTVFCVLGVFSHYKVIGGGDLKLITAVTLLVQPGQIGLLLVEIALAGGVLSCIYFASHLALKNLRLPQSAGGESAFPPTGFAAVLRTERARISSGASLPYAVAVLGGVSIYTARGIAQCSYAASCLL